MTTPTRQGPDRRTRTRARRLAVARLGGLAVMVALGGCTGAAMPPVVTVTVTSAQSTAAATSSTQTAPSTSTTTTTAGVTFDAYPKGYDYAYVRAIKRVGSQWVVALDPITMCHPTSTEPACAQAVKGQMDDDYAIVNVSTRVYTVALAAGTTIQRIGPSGQPNDYVASAPADGSYPASGAGTFLAEVTLSATSQVTSVKEWWHP